MQTLYEILGLSRSATEIQIEQAYQVHSDRFKGEGRLLPEAENIKLRAIEEAYSVLSSPLRRQRYDRTLATRAAPQVVLYDEVEKTPRWFAVFALIGVIAAGGYLYKRQSDEARLAQLRIEAEKAKAQALATQQQAEAERLRAEQEKLQRQKEVEAARNREMLAARQEGQQVSAQLQQFEARQEQEKRRMETQAQWDKQRQEQASLQEQYAAKARAAQQTAAWERALSRPVGGYIERPGGAVMPLNTLRKEDAAHASGRN